MDAPPPPPYPWRRPGRLPPAAPRSDRLGVSEGWAGMIHQRPPDGPHHGMGPGLRQGFERQGREGCLAASSAASLAKARAASTGGAAREVVGRWQGWAGMIHHPLGRSISRRGPWPSPGIRVVGEREGCCLATSSAVSLAKARAASAGGAAREVVGRWQGWAGVIHHPPGRSISRRGPWLSPGIRGREWL